MPCSFGAKVQTCSRQTDMREAGHKDAGGQPKRKCCRPAKQPSVKPRVASDNYNSLK